MDVLDGGSGKDQYCGDNLDPRIQVELDRLNKASDAINRLELQLDEARASFRQVLTESTQRLNLLSKTLGASVEKARPYYEARMKAKDAQLNTQNAALRYERACGQLSAAKEMVYLAEQGYFMKGQSFDPAWQEMLNHATGKVNGAELERFESEIEHKRLAALFNEAEQRVKRYQKELKRAITKSRPYFEMKAKFNQEMEDRKKKVGLLEETVTDAKGMYSGALQNLEAISDQIHKQRGENNLRRQMGNRGAGVGAETPSPPPTAEGATRADSTPITDTGQSESEVVAETERESQHERRAGPVSDHVHNKNNIKSSQVLPTSQGTQGSRAQLHLQGLQSNHSKVMESSLGRNQAKPPQDQIYTATSHKPEILQGHQNEAARVSPVTLPKSVQSRQVLGAEAGASTNKYYSNKDNIQGHRSDEANTQLAQDDRLEEKHQNTSKPNTDKEEGIDYRGVAENSELNDRKQPLGGEDNNPTLLHIPTIDLTTPGSETSPSCNPTSPTPTTVTSPESEPDAYSEQTRMNAEIMDRIQKLKGSGKPFLRPNRSSLEDLLDDASDTESLTSSRASVSMLDDEQVDSLMRETGEYYRFLSRLDETERDKWQSLPGKLAYLENYIRVQPECAETDCADVGSSEVTSPSDTGDLATMSSSPDIQITKL